MNNNSIANFFANSDQLDYLVLRPLSHIDMRWELTWDMASGKYQNEEGNFSSVINELIKELEETGPPAKYHDNEDALAEYVKKNSNWNIQKIDGRWVGADYQSILEQGGFNDMDQTHLVQAAAGRIKGAIDRGQTKFDDMEKGHKNILAAVLSIILYHRIPLLK